MLSVRAPAGVPAPRARGRADRLRDHARRQGGRAERRDPGDPRRQRDRRRRCSPPRRSRSGAPCEAPPPRRALTQSRSPDRLPAVDFELSPRVEELRERIRAFMDEHVYPVEMEALRALDDEVKPGVAYPQILVEIRERARDEGLWNLFMPDERYGAGPDQLGVRRCSARRWAAARRSRRWRSTAPRPTPATWRSSPSTAPTSRRSAGSQPLLDGEIRSCFSMTEPEVSGSDPTTLQTRAELDDGEWVINGHKWFTSGAVGRRRGDRDGRHRSRRPPVRARVDDPRAHRQPRLQPRPPGARDGPRRRARATARSATRTAACRRPTCSARARPAS